MGTLSIHFTAEDVARTRLARRPDPLWEIVCSLHRLQTKRGYAAYEAGTSRPGSISAAPG